MNKTLKRCLAALSCGALILSLAGCASGSASGSATNQSAIRVGSKDFTEGLIVSEIYALALENAGFEVERVFDIAGSLVHTSLVNKEIDLYPEYTGTGLLTVLGMDAITDPQLVYDTVKEEYKKQFQITWLDYAEANDGHGMVIRTDVAQQLGIATISDLQAHASELRFASQGEFDVREDGLPALAAMYGPFDWKNSRVYDGGLKYQVLSSNEADVTIGYTTDGALADTDSYTLLEDDKRVWPPYNLAPVVRDEVLEQNPEIAEVLNAVSAKLDTATLTKMNAQVDVEKQEYEDVAAAFLASIQ